MKPTIFRLASDYSMILVLLTLCLFFSAATYREQTLTGAAAGRQLTRMIKSEIGGMGRVMIVVGDLKDDLAMADQIQQGIESAKGQVVAVVAGEPKDAVKALQRIAASDEKLDVIVATQATGDWEVFSDLARDYPSLGTPTIMTPRPYHWPIFLKSENLMNIANQIAAIAIVAIGMTMVIITGGIDLSVGSVIALSAVITSVLIRDFAGGSNASIFGMTMSCLVAIILCGFVGAFSGAMITRFGVPPFIVTLAMMRVGTGLANKMSEGQSIADIPESFVWLGRGAYLFGFPNTVLLMIMLYVMAHIMMSQTRLGRYLYAVGGNREAARLSGVPVERVLLFAYIASSLLAALGGVILASQFKSGSPLYGRMYELDVITAAVVGGASLSGGEGKMFGTLTGAFTIAVIQNGMNLMKIDPFTQDIVLGLLILGAVLMDRIRHR